MGHIAKHSVTLSAELSTAVEEAVASGEYPSVDAVVGEALGRWKDERELFGYTIEELRALAQQGIDSGPGQFADMASIKAEALSRLERSKETS
jgi:antitoxin ParD1/3/4